jgi:1,2-dihydroxy-3-keto-5-methylthiopentene dioxygenase
MAVDTLTPAFSASAPQTKEEMKKKKDPIKAWYYKENDDLPCKAHQYNPNRAVSQEHLDKLGVLTWTGIETEGFEKNEFLNKIKAVRGYNFEEVLTVSPEKLPNYEANTKKFFLEHLHDNEEIRFIIDGVGYEDVRDFDGHWIRIEIKKGVLIVLPPGMYHRFTLDENLFLKALLLYQTTPDRIQFEKNPVTDAMECRLEYVRSFLDTAPEKQPMEDKALAAATKSMEAISV